MIKSAYIRNILLVVLFASAGAFAQDIHLSQFYDSPLTYNPATAGAFAADYRVVTNYKSQWKSISNPYTTIAATADMKILKSGRDEKNYLASGISFLRDKAGKSAMGLMQVNLNTAYKLQITRSSSLSSGVQVGFAQRSISTAGLMWDNQFDGNNYDASRPTGENGLTESKRNLDLGAGIEYRHYNTFSKFKLNMGASAYHLHQPNISFISSAREKLYRKYIAYSTAQIRIPEAPIQMYIIPQAMFTLQGPQKEIMAGGHVRFVFGADMTEDDVILNTFSLASSYIQVGALYRFKDAVILSASMEMHKSFSIGLSYDLNISKLKTATSLRGGMELSLMYIIKSVR